MMKLKPMADGQWGVFEDDTLVALSFNWFVAVLKCAAWQHGTLETRTRMQRELVEVKEDRRSPYGAERV